MPCFTAEISNNQICFNCSAHKPGEDESGAGHSFIGLLDTGAQKTGITQKVVDAVGLSPVSWGSVTGVSGVVETPIYLLDIGIAVSEHSRHTDGSIIESVFGKGFRSRQVSLLDFGENSAFDILIGMDVITECHLTIHSQNLYTLCI